MAQHLFDVPVTITASVVIAATDINVAISEARRYAEACGDNGHFRDGWNSIQRDANGPEVLNVSSFDTETVEAVEVDYGGKRWEFQPQRDWNADMGLPHDAGTRIEPCDPARATSWGVFERVDMDTKELTEDYPTQAQAEAAIAALEAGEPLPTPIWDAEPATASELASELSDALASILQADCDTDAEAFAAAMRGAGALLARMGVVIEREG